jgi:hypothetical protein
MAIWRLTMARGERIAKGPLSPSVPAPSPRTYSRIKPNVRFHVRPRKQLVIARGYGTEMISAELIGACFPIETVPRAQFCPGNQHDGGSWDRLTVRFLPDTFDSRAIVGQGDFQGRLSRVGNGEAFLHRLGVLRANALRYQIAAGIDLHVIMTWRQARVNEPSSERERCSV